MKNQNKLKTLYKVLSILLIIGGLVLIVFGFIDFIQVYNYNTNLEAGGTYRETNMLWSLLAAPLLFGGFFLFALGFGNKKEYEKK